VNIEPLIGKHSSLVNDPSAAWLDDGTQVVMVPGPDSRPGKGTLPGPGKACGQQSRAGLCMIVVDNAANPLRARAVFVPHLLAQDPAVMAGVAGHGSTLLIGASTVGSPDITIDSVDLAGSRAVAHHVVKLPGGAELLAIAPAGDKVLVGGPPGSGSWVAAIRDGRLIHRHLVPFPARFRFDEVAW
jgi:hypothetical protein